MSARQTSVINGLLAENIGKNDLVRSYESKSHAAERRASDAEHSARMNENAARVADVLSLRVARLEAELRESKKEVQVHRELLSRPMKEIADVSGDFKKTYEIQQQMLAEWIMGQKAYRETAMQLGIALEMTPEQVQKVAAPNYTAVIENRTTHGNDATTSPTLSTYASAILEARKKSGKA